MKNTLTNIRTLAQFSQYGQVKRILYNGNKLMAMNALRLAYGVKQFSILHEFSTDVFLPQGNYSDSN